jgi:hypothetical protein
VFLSYELSKRRSTKGVMEVYWRLCLDTKDLSIKQSEEPQSIRARIVLEIEDVVSGMIRESGSKRAEVLS